jgi:hypothetical protein
MMSFTGDGQLDPALQQQRDEMRGISSEEVGWWGGREVQFVLLLFCQFAYEQQLLTSFIMDVLQCAQVDVAA